MKPGKCFTCPRKSFKMQGIVLLMVALGGCSNVHYSVVSAPVRPEDCGRFAVSNPKVSARVQIANFEIRKVDTQYPKREKEVFRRHNAVAIPNLVQEFLGTRQAFSEVTRVATAKPDATDYVITGTYDFFGRAGGNWREWIPFAGAFGARINEATVKGTLSVRIVEAKSGTVVFEKAFTEEHTDRTSIYQWPRVGYLQADYLGQIASEVIKAVSDHRGSR